MCTQNLNLQKWYNSYKWNLYRVITWKFLFDGEGMTEEWGKLNLLSVIFLVWEISVIFLLDGILPPSQRFSKKVQRKEAQSTPGGGNKATSKEGKLLWYRGYNSGRQCCWTLLCINGISSSNKLFQISYDCVTDSACCWQNFRQNLSKSY